jgi:FkbM family methyltransferase
VKNWFRRVPLPTPRPVEDAPAIRVDPDMVAPAMSLDARIHMATLCRDADALAKVADAGSVRSEPDGSRVQIMHNGLRVVADGYCGAWMTDLIARCHGHHEPQEERVFHDLVTRLPEAATMIELGGWWAFYTLWFLQDRPRRRGLVIEPDPRHLAVGEANAALNGMTVPFRNGLAGATPGAPRGFRTESGEEVVIPRLSVPQLMAEHGFDQLDLLHCDAQGVELDVLESCADLLRGGRIRTVVISTHHWRISGDPLTHQRCLNRVQAWGGHVIAKHDVHEGFSGDGLIAAAFGPGATEFPPITLSHNRYSTSLFRNPLYDLAERPWLEPSSPR